MARIYPFRALRYDPTRIHMEDVVTQPYDKITPEMQQRYYDASPYNLVRVILGKKEPTDTDAQDFLPAGELAHNVYTRAAQSLNAWRREGILKEEAEPALYGYAQTYTVPDTEEIRERRGFIALGHLYDYADKVVYRHEQTFPKHKSDRLALFKATRAYCEQIYMLYADPAFTAEKLIFGTGGAGQGAGKAGEDTTPADPRYHRRIRRPAPRLEAHRPYPHQPHRHRHGRQEAHHRDGHHRYETSVAYARERSAQLRLPLNQPLDEDEKLSSGNLPIPAFPEAAMMMTFVNMDAPGITILPAPRPLRSRSFSSADFITRASRFFSITELPGPGLAQLSATEGTAFIAVTVDGSYLLAAKPEVIAAALRAADAGISPRQAKLDVVQLHRIVLDQLLGLDQETITRLGNVRYIREAEEAVTLVTTGDANIAFLIKPVTLDQLRDISLSGDVMPQKSTDFYPKLLSGLAIYALD